MRPIKTFFAASTILASTVLVTQAHAISAFGTPLNAAYPGKTLYTGSCLTCHANPSGDNIAWFSQYGKILLLNGANYDSPGTFPGVITRAGAVDYDNDGFTVDQEIYGNSFANGGLAGNPALSFIGSTAGAGGKEFGLATAPATLNTLSSTLNNSTYIAVPTGHRNIVSGVVDYTLQLNDVVATSGTVKLLFNTGGIQTNPTVQFVNTLAGTSTSITASALDADGGSWTVGNDGSITVTITDDGAFDLYTTANFQAEAIARTVNFTPTNVFDAYAGVSPDAKISPLATVISGATIDPYAIIDAYAVISATATIRSYAYIAPNVNVTSIVDAYASANTDVTTQLQLPNPVGTVQSRLAISTSAPVTGAVGGSAVGGDGDDGGGLHCMTAGLSTYAFMLFGLLAAGLLVKRKRS